MTIKEAIRKVSDRHDLSEKEMRDVFNVIMGGKAAPAQIGAFITALKMKGETVDEITGAARVMRERSLKLKKITPGVLDTCGTGGTGSDTFNVSTASAFVASACGVKVAKHGNRSVSSRCGSADVLEELGVRVDVPVTLIGRSIREIGLGFLFAPLFHSAMRYAAPVRRDLSIRTIFNILGPLSSPVAAEFHVMGVYDPELTEVMAKVLRNLGAKRVFAVHGEGCVDEVSIYGKTRISELKKGRVRTFYLSPSDFGLKKRRLGSVRGGNSKKNAEILKNVLSGRAGAFRDIVLMNSGMALIAAGKENDLKNAVSLAAEAIDSGEAMRKLDMLITMTSGACSGK